MIYRTWSPPLAVEPDPFPWTKEDALWYQRRSAASTRAWTTFIAVALTVVSAVWGVLWAVILLFR